MAVVPDIKVAIDYAYKVEPKRSRRGYHKVVLLQTIRVESSEPIETKVTLALCRSQKAATSIVNALQKQNVTP